MLLTFSAIREWFILPIITNPTTTRSIWCWGVVLASCRSWFFIIFGHLRSSSFISLVPSSPASSLPTSAQPSSPWLNLNKKSVLWPCFFLSLFILPWFRRLLLARLSFSPLRIKPLIIIKNYPVITSSYVRTSILTLSKAVSTKYQIRRIISASDWSVSGI